MDKSKEKGQALIEFVLLLPIIIFLILAVIDIGRILYMKTWLESKMNDVVYIVNKDNQDTNELKNILRNNEQVLVKIKNSNNKTEITLSTEISFLTPGFNLILDNPYDIKTKRIVIHD